MALSACTSLDDATPSLPSSSLLPPDDSPLQEPQSPLDFPDTEDQKPATERLFGLAREDLASTLSVEMAKIELVEAQSMEWHDTSLGCPEPGKLYAQVITPGYRLTLSVDGKLYVYHTDEGHQAVRCDEKP
jgi:hypothetical protein